MSRVTKIAISLPRDILEIVERECSAKGESRSEFFRRAIQALLQQQRERSAIEQYTRGYRQVPETEEEIQAAHQAAAAVLAEEPWE